ncbi:GvpL/GvpF family gas vesicle protein [Streptomyces sp. NPDC051219]|uniref:GvpL/GvpF family gas vesicle protein n=1 Tax=Streptomyces sp. NPDC051219 TaxID=3155283 RepID=UPI00344416A3
MTGNGIYVYGIVRSGRRVPAEQPGVGGVTVVPRIVREGSVAAVVSDAPAQLRARRRDLLAHQSLLLALADGGPVLPMRFGTVAPDEEAVRRELEVRAQSHLDMMERLAGMAEANVKAMPAADGLARLLREDASVRRLREEARRRPGYETDIRLGEAVARGLSRRAAEAAGRLMTELVPHATAAHRGAEVPGCVLNVSLLLDKNGYRAVEAVVNRFATTHKDLVELRLTGPLPCYSFVAPDAAAVGRRG